MNAIPTTFSPRVPLPHNDNRAFLCPHTGKSPIFDIDCTPRECRLYHHFTALLLIWAETGYPRDRLTQDLHRHTAR